MKRAELEREANIEELRRIALAQHGAIEALVAQLKAKCKALAKLTGNGQELQQTLALIATLVKEQPAAPLVTVPPDTSNDASGDASNHASGAEPTEAPRNDDPSDDPSPRRRRRTGPTPQPALFATPRVYELPKDQQSCDACGGDLQVWADQFETSEMIDVVEPRSERSLVRSIPGPL